MRRTKEDIEDQMNALKRELEQMEAEKAASSESMPEDKPIYLIYDDKKGDLSFSSFEEWCDKIATYMKAGKGRSFYVRYSYGFDKELKKLKLRELELDLNRFNSKQGRDDLKNFIYSADDFGKMRSLKMGVINRSDDTLVLADFMTESFKSLIDEVENAQSFEKGNDLMARMDAWRLKI